ncbi:hypothetical protein H8356DRAFT_1351436 [Neocallimastix lanati (nom. inval.)]|nr:hypothetical protein H8356DRAFT_1351436 [Neocallimastix sp. JGI-2020a]
MTSQQRILETIPSDLIGPINIISCTGKKFIVTFIDKYSRKDVPKTKQLLTLFLKWQRVGSKNFWDDAVNSAKNHLYNIHPHKGIDNEYSSGLNFKTHSYIIMDYESLKIHLVTGSNFFDEDQPLWNFKQNSNDQPKTNLKKIDINEQNDNSNFDIECNDIIANLKTHLKLLLKNNFHIAHNNNKRFKSSIGKRRHSSLDEEFLNKWKQIKYIIISSYQPNPFTKRREEESDLYYIQYLIIFPVKRPGNHFENNNAKKKSKLRRLIRMFRVSLSFKEAVTTKYKTKWLSVINDELNNL